MYLLAAFSLRLFAFLILSRACNQTSILTTDVQERQALPAIHLHGHARTAHIIGPAVV